MDATRKSVRAHSSKYVAGWLDSSIHDFLEVFPAASKSAAYALITCLDSNLNPRSLLENGSEFNKVMQNAKPLGSGLLVSAKRFQDPEFRSQLFFGFDEVWFFPSNRIEPKPDSTWIVGPGRIDQAALDQIGPWMADNGCSLGLGDGDGLNVILKAHGLVKGLIAHSLSQPEPVLRTSESLREDSGENQPRARCVRI